MRISGTLNQLAKRSWQALRSKFVVICIVAALVLAPIRARGQFGLDPCCAIISTGLNSISGLLKSVVARPLSSIQQIQQQAATFEQQVVYPLGALNSARGLAGQLRSQLQQTTQLFRLPMNSATLPNPRQLEQTLLSHDPQALGQITQDYAAVYGEAINPGNAPQPIRDLVDMTDAEAQTAFKKAVELDALSDAELAAADQINQQIQSAAPGSAAILEAQASAWLVRANAYTQSALAELIRVRAIDLANSGAQLKLSASDLDTLRKNAEQAIQRGVR